MSRASLTHWARARAAATASLWNFSESALPRVVWMTSRFEANTV